MREHITHHVIPGFIGSWKETDVFRQHRLNQSHHISLQLRCCIYYVCHYTLGVVMCFVWLSNTSQRVLFYFLWYVPFRYSTSGFSGICPSVIILPFCSITIRYHRQTANIIIIFGREWTYIYLVLYSSSLTLQYLRNRAYFNVPN